MTFKFYKGNNKGNLYRKKGKKVTRECSEIDAFNCHFKGYKLLN